jgi:hypothetical protein
MVELSEDLNREEPHIILTPYCYVESLDSELRAFNSTLSKTLGFIDRSPVLSSTQKRESQ